MKILSKTPHKKYLKSQSFVCFSQGIQRRGSFLYNNDFDLDCFDMTNLLSWFVGFGI